MSMSRSSLSRRLMGFALGPGEELSLIISETLSSSMTVPCGPYRSNKRNVSSQSVVNFSGSSPILKAEVMCAYRNISE
jgi:hypothetical protein